MAVVEWGGGTSYEAFQHYAMASCIGQLGDVSVTDVGVNIRYCLFWDSLQFTLLCILYIRCCEYSLYSLLYSCYELLSAQWLSATLIAAPLLCPPPTSGYPPRGPRSNGTHLQAAATELVETYIHGNDVVAWLSEGNISSLMIRADRSWRHARGFSAPP